MWTQGQYTKPKQHTHTHTHKHSNWNANERWQLPRGKKLSSFVTVCECVGEHAEKKKKTNKIITMSSMLMDQILKHTPIPI